jgi:hypothetical protein
MKLAIFGDSFAFRQPDLDNVGWSILLEDHYQVDNFAQAGISEYKILVHMQGVNLESYDQIIISHTSPNRVYVPFNPLHQQSQYHKNCDIIFADIENNHDEFSQACQLYFKHIFDLDHAQHIHNMICREIDDLTKKYNTLHISHFDYSALYQFSELIDFYKVWSQHKGTVNHYSKQGNQLVYNTIMSNL